MSWRRAVLHAVVLATIAGSTIGTALAHHAPETAVCRQGALVTSYSSEDYPGRTSDGTSTVAAIRNGEWIAAASRSIPLGAIIEINGEMTYRVADRGLLDENGITADILMATTAEARQWGARRVTLCWWQT